MEIPNLCSMSCCSWVPTLISCADPIPFSQRVSLYWRDSVMLTGLVIAVVGAVAAFFQGAFLLGVVLTVASAVIGFGSHYVSRYAELEEMKKQLAALQLLNTNLDGKLAGFTAANEDLENSVAALNSSLRVMSDDREEALRLHAELKISDQHLAKALDQLHRLQPELRIITAEIDKAQAKVHAAISVESDIQASIITKTEHLGSILIQIESQTRRLEAVTARLEQHIDSLPEVVADAFRQTRVDPNQFSGSSSVALKVVVEQ